MTTSDLKVTFQKLAYAEKTAKAALVLVDCCPNVGFPSFEGSEYMRKCLRCDWNCQKSVWGNKAVWVRCRENTDSCNV